MPTAASPIYPVRAVASTDELMGIAVAMEREAALRYDQLAAAMAERGEHELAELFRFLSEQESDHETGLGRWAEREGRAAPVPARFAWTMPEAFVDPAAAATVLTPYGALAVALANEERAFTFYAYLAALAPGEDIRRRAKALAREELAHVRQLRAMRRRALHGGRRAPRGPKPARDLAQFGQAVTATEAGAASLDEAAARIFAAAGHTDAAAVLAAQAEAARARGQRFGALPAVPEPVLMEPGAALRRCLRNAEDAAALYLATAGEAIDDALVQAAETLAAEAVARLAALCPLAETLTGAAVRSS